MLLPSLIVLLVLSSAVSGFVAPRFASPGLFEARWSSSSSPSQTSTRTSKSSPTASRGHQTLLFAEMRRNIFHDYDKPIVLLGMSSAQDELSHLADALQSRLGGGKILTTIDNDNDNDTKWPNIVVLDTAEGDSDSVLETAKKLYEDDGMLSIYINVDSSQMDESAEERKNKLDAAFVKYSDYEVCIKDEASSDGMEHIEWELARIVARARLIPAIPGDKTRSTNTAHLTMGQNTFFLSLSFPEISSVEPYVQEMCKDVDAMEYRTDLLACRDSRFELLYGMQLLRRYCRPHTVRVPALPLVGSVLEDVMPIVYTVRTQNQAGTYPDDADGIEKMFELLAWGLRGGVEVLDVESAWDPSKTDALLKLAEERYSSQILGSHHVVGKEIELEEAVGLFEQCSLDGRAHGAKVVLSIEDDDKDRMAYEAALISEELAASEGRPVIPNISLILGDNGQFSRVINLPFTPVTHESLPFKAAPGQLTSNEIMTTRLLTKIFQSKKYAILGHKIAYSVSPQMHGAAFAATKLPHEYLRVDVETVEEFINSPLFQSADFGGTSVTIPHKQAIMPYVDVMSDEAKSIGSVNTVIVKEEFVDEDFKRVIYGDNTDWRGIFNPLDRLLGSSVNPSTDYALILGAGGTARAAAFVADKLGLRRIYYNRTPSKALDLVDAFGGVLVKSLSEKSGSEDGESLGDILAANPDSRIRVVISTLPAAAKFVLPEWVLASDPKPVIFDVNYKPFNTELLLQAAASGCSLVRGSEMLWEQGVGQFELWTERTAPYSVMKNVVLENCQESKADTAKTTPDSVSNKT